MVSFQGKSEDFIEGVLFILDKIYEAPTIEAYTFEQVQDLVALNKKLSEDRPHGRWENDRLEKHSLHVGDCSKCGEKGVIGNFCMWCGSDNRVKEGE